MEMFVLAPTVNTLVCRAMVVKKDRAHMIDLIDRKTHALADFHVAWTLELQDAASERIL